MSVASVLIPAEAALGTALTVARPLIGLGLVAALLVFFKPFLAGLLRAALMVIAPRTRMFSGREIAQDAMQVNRMAREVEGQHPALAAELRAIAARH